MPSYGLIFTIDKKRIYFTADTQLAPSQIIAFYEEADLIFQDCETLTKKTGVHAHYSDLVKLPAKIKKKMWLYHYNPGVLPNAKEDGFQGFIQKGQYFNF
jgi:L-ascorbate metabolism protein UlaG (beta-lactamase superfamily)